MQPTRHNRETGRRGRFKKTTAFLLLAAFIVAKALFWISLTSLGPSLFATSTEEANQFSHPCACSGAPVCSCEAASCCESERLEFASPNDSKTQIHSPFHCGQLSQGVGPMGKMPTESPAPEVCRLFPTLSQSFHPVVVNLPTGLIDPPTPPPPNA